MIRALITLVFCILFYPQYSQSTILYSPIEPQDNIILDAKIENDTFLALQISIDTLKSSDLLILDTGGNFLSRSELGETPFNAMRFLKVKNHEVYLIGRFKTDSCQSSIATVKYDMQSKSLSTISEFPFCDKNVQNLRLADQLDSGWFINGYWVHQGYQTFLLKMDTSYNLSFVMDSLGHQQISIDFSRKGYVLKTQDICNFYDRDFNYRKQRYNFQDGRFSLHQTHLPYGDYYILESYSAAPDYENEGQYIRLIDSSLHIKKEVFVTPAIENEPGINEPPFFGGIDFINESNIWMAGNNNQSSNLTLPTHFSISKINKDFQIVCNQYIGFDASYRIYGISATPDGGVIAYGMKFNETYDPYIIKLGPNCELPTVSTTDPHHPLVSISAYPNPTINSLTFDVNGFDPASLIVEIFDSKGIILFSKKDLSYEIKVADMPPGQYFYRILEGEKLLGVGAWVKQ